MNRLTDPDYENQSTEECERCCYPVPPPLLADYPVGRVCLICASTPDERYFREPEIVGQINFIGNAILDQLGAFQQASADVQITLCELNRAIQTAIREAEDREHNTKSDRGTLSDQHGGNDENPLAQVRGTGT